MNQSTILVYPPDQWENQTWCKWVSRRKLRRNRTFLSIRVIFEDENSCKLKVTNQVNTTGKKIPTGRRAFSMIQWIGDLPSTLVETKDKSSWKLTKRGFESGESVFQFSTLNNTIILLVKPTEKRLSLTQNIKCHNKTEGSVIFSSYRKLNCCPVLVNVISVSMSLGTVVDITTHPSVIFLITCFSYSTTEFFQIHCFIVNAKYKFFSLLQNSTLNNVFLGFCGCGFDNRSHPVAMKTCAFFVP